MISLLALASAYALSTGNDVLEICDGSQKDDAICAAWAAGVASGLQATRHVTGVCSVEIPRGVTNGQVADIIVSYLRKHPENREWNAGFLALEAVGQAYPCRLRRPG